MERLTEKHYLGTDYYMKCSENCHVDMDCIDCPSFDRLVERLAAYEDTGLEPESVEALKLSIMGKAISKIKEFNGLPIARLRELADADKDGRVVAPPCKVGQRVFALLDTDKHISECEVKRIVLGNEIGFVDLEPIGARWREYGVSLNGFGKTVFLTREEADKALEAMKDG
mgnify:CR=1 FL=1|jgi:hypothetical protein